MKNQLKSTIRPLEPLGGKRLSLIAVVLSTALIVMTGPKVFSSLLQVYLIDRIAKQLPYDASMVELSDTVQQVMSIVVLVFYIPFFVVFLLWLRKRYANLGYFRHNTTYQAGWAIGSFFVPLLNFVRPFQIVKETMKQSARKLRSLTSTDVVLLYSWWIVFWADNILGQIVFRTLPKEGASIENYISFSWTVAASDLVECALFPLYLLLILRIGSKQDQSLQEMTDETP